MIRQTEDECRMELADLCVNMTSNRLGFRMTSRFRRRETTLLFVRMIYYTVF